MQTQALTEAKPLMQITMWLVSLYWDIFPNYWSTTHFLNVLSRHSTEMCTGLNPREFKIFLSLLAFPGCGIHFFSSGKWRVSWNWYSAGMANHQILHGHCLQRRELGEKMTAFWITPLLARWIKHVRGPAGATADSMSRLELWEVGVASTLGENGVWLTMGRVLLWEQQVKPEQLNGFLPRIGVRGRGSEQDVLTSYMFLWKAEQRLHTCCNLWVYALLE